MCLYLSLATCEALFCRWLSGKEKTTPILSYLAVGFDNDFITKSEAESHASIRVSVSRYRGMRSLTINLPFNHEAPVTLDGYEYRGDLALALVYQRKTLLPVSTSALEILGILEVHQIADLKTPQNTP